MKWITEPRDRLQVDGHHLTQNTTDVADQQGKNSTNFAGPTGKPLKKKLNWNSTSQQIQNQFKMA